MEQVKYTSAHRKGLAKMISKRGGLGELLPGKHILVSHEELLKSNPATVRRVITYFAQLSQYLSLTMIVVM